MHWPAPMISPPSLCKPNKDLDWLNTWREMEKVYLANKDKVKAIGVSSRLKRRLLRAKYCRLIDSFFRSGF